MPDVVTRPTLKQCQDSTAVTELKRFEGRGHLLTVDSGWKKVADTSSIGSRRTECERMELGLAGRHPAEALSNHRCYRGRRTFTN